MSDLTDEYIDSIARNRGYIDYPSDSIEAGSVWHIDTATAPFGSTVTKVGFREHIRALVCNLTKNSELVNVIKAEGIEEIIEEYMDESEDGSGEKDIHVIRLALAKADIRALKAHIKSLEERISKLGFKGNHLRKYIYYLESISSPEGGNKSVKKWEELQNSNY